jgi:hypothetical protein
VHAGAARLQLVDAGPPLGQGALQPGEALVDRSAVPQGAVLASCTSANARSTAARGDEVVTPSA